MLNSIGNFGFEPTGPTETGKVIDVVLRNTGNETLDIATIANNAIDSPFSIQSENCSDTSLDPVSDGPTSTCTISLLSSINCFKLEHPIFLTALVVLTPI